MHDDLIKRLRQDAPTALVNCDFDFVVGWIEEAADAIEELSVIVRAQKAVLDKSPRWIPVSERLPEVNERVMACVKVFGELLVYDATRWNGEQWETEVEAYYDYWAKIDEHVTHWMPLPEPPKEE